MGARAVEGKPGSGKTCYVVYLMMILLSDWARYKKENGEEYPRKLYTNIPLDIVAVNRYLSDSLDFPVDVSGQIVLLSDDFFCDGLGDYVEWWEKFPEQAYIVIDEFQFLLSSSSKKDKEGKDHTEKFMLYISKHRHRGHDIILLSQSIKNISVEARRQLEVIYAVLNVKNITVGRWPFTIPMQDIDVVRESWGMASQMAHIKRGVFEQDKIKYDKGCEVFLLQPKIFALYRSVTMASECLDRPSLKLGRFGSLWWLFRRHAFRLGGWTVAVIALLLSVKNAIGALPHILMDCVTIVDASPVPVPKNDIVTTKDGEKRVALPGTPEDDKITGFVRGGIITPRGILRINDHLIYEGEKDYVKSVDVRHGILYLGSGKKVQK